MLDKRGAAGLCFPVLFLPGSGHSARWFPCHWAGVAEPLWKLHNVGQSGSYLPASVLHHITAVFPHKLVFTLKPLPSLPWQKTPTCVVGYYIGCLVFPAGMAAGRSWAAFRILIYCHKRLNYLLLNFLIWAVVLLPKWSWNGQHTPCVHREFHGEKKENNHSAAIKHQFEINTDYLYSLWCFFPNKYILESNNINNKYLEISKK